MIVWQSGDIFIKDTDCMYSALTDVSPYLPGWDESSQNKFETRRGNK